MDANISPPLLIKHVIHMAQNKKMPILLLPKLKIITLNTIGFASAACALTVQLFTYGNSIVKALFYPFIISISEYRDNFFRSLFPLFVYNDI